MLAFAANSLLCRLALGSNLIDAATFAAVRIITGALVLSLIVWPRWRARGRAPGDWRSAAALFAYLVCFSFAYLSVGAATGALILFGAAQLTMIAAAVRGGETLRPAALAGFALAIVGLVILVSPGLTAPEPFGASLMAIAGLAWGVYSLRGRGAGDPLEATLNNFLYLIAPVVMLWALSRGNFHASWHGLAIAGISGAVATGLGYVVWYQAVQRLSAIRAAAVQLSVPVIAAIGGALALSEAVTLRLTLASVATLGGIAVVLTARTTRDEKA